MILSGSTDALAAPSDSSVALIRTLTVTVFLLWLGSTSIIPMLPVYIRHLGGSDLLAGLVMASFFGAGVLSQYPVGRLADRLGRKPVLVGGLVVYAAASFAFLLPLAPAMAILLRGTQGVGAGASAVASLAMVSGAVAVERRGRAFASIFSAEIAGMAVGPLIGSVVGAHHMWIMFLGSGTVALVAGVPAVRIVEPPEEAELRRARTNADGSVEPLAGLHWNRSMIGALVAAAALGLTSGVYDICWTLLLLSRGAASWQIGVSWTLFAVPFVIASRPSGWLADHIDRRYLVLVGLGLAAVFCTSYPFIHWVPALMVLGATEALGFAAAMPALQSLLTQGSEPSEVGRIQGLFGTTQTALTAVSAAAAGAVFALASWMPFVSAASFTAAALVVAAVVWRPVAGHVQTATTRGAVVAGARREAQPAGGSVSR
ncbi:MAG: MFS transporter [Acidimicrobiales bacterium]|jgi:DHA1 family multidrug resistance protein-like MFS transporter